MATESGNDYYWCAVLGGEMPPGDEPVPGAWQGLAYHLSPGLLRALLEERGLAVPDALAEAAEAAGLLQRFTAAAQRQWLGRLIDAGFAPVALKGFGIAHRYYGAAAMWRRTGDLDLLFAPDELDAARDWLREAGFAHRTVDEKPWGSLHDTSEAPFVAPDGSVTIDLHNEADAPPLPRGLSRAAVFAAAESVREDGLLYRMPSPTHGLIISLSNAAKDKFGPHALRRGVDVARILDRDGGGLDWDAVEGVLMRARLLRPSRYFLRLLIELGMPETLVPAGLTALPRGPGRRTFRHVLRDWQTASSTPPTRATLAAREWLLAAEPATALGYSRRRIAGLARRYLARGA